MSCCFSLFHFFFFSSCRTSLSLWHPNPLLWSTGPFQLSTSLPDSHSLPCFSLSKRWAACGLVSPPPLFHLQSLSLRKRCRPNRPDSCTPLSLSETWRSSPLLSALSEALHICCCDCCPGAGKNQHYIIDESVCLSNKRPASNTLLAHWHGIPCKHAKTEAQASTLEFHTSPSSLTLIYHRCMDWRIADIWRATGPF